MDLSHLQVQVRINIFLRNLSSLKWEDGAEVC